MSVVPCKKNDKLCEQSIEFPEALRREAHFFPSTIPSPRNNPNPKAQKLEDVEILQAFNVCFKGDPSEINYVDFEVCYTGSDILRKTVVNRGGTVRQSSAKTPIRRT